MQRNTKKNVRKFEEGTPQQWVDLIKDLREIWKQNGIEEGSDRVATIRSLIKGESGTAFETALQDLRTNEGEEEKEITKENVELALKAVATTVFPHRALEIQKLWMNRRMFKPVELTTRQTSAAINRLNNALPLFPGGSENSKFAETEIIGLLEWSLPPAWRTKFDLDGYIPTLDTKTRLIEACEAIERNEAIDDKETTKKGRKSIPKNRKTKIRASHKQKVRGRKNTNIFVPSTGTTLRIVPAIVPTEILQGGFKRRSTLSFDERSNCSYTLSEPSSIPFCFQISLKSLMRSTHCCGVPSSNLRTFFLYFVAFSA